MRQLQLTAYGEPADVVELNTVSEPVLGQEDVLVSMEAAPVGLGHTVKLMPLAYVKAYMKRGKTDAADAEAICEAVTRPSMRFRADQVARAAGGAVDASCA